MRPKDRNQPQTFIYDYALLNPADTEAAEREVNRAARLIRDRREAKGLDMTKAEQDWLVDIQGEDSFPASDPPGNY
jgi:hypothetical protein